jgi:two-component system, OmpR family, phosphate regulon sensor histidine kinase PhoR
MHFIDLRWLLSIFFILTGAIAALVVWLDRRRRRRQGAALFDPRGAGPVLERAPFGWLVLDGATSYRYANPYARRLLDLSASAGTLPEADWVTALQKDRSAGRGTEAALGRHRSVPLPSGKVARWWVTPWRDWDVAFLLDITAQKQAEEASRYLLNGLSHELHTPLSGILTHLEILQLPDISAEIRQQSLRMLKTEAQRISRLIRLMLELGRLETSAELERRPVDLMAVAEQAVAQLAPQAEQRGIAFSLQANTPVPLVVGDRDRLMQVFLNLLDNVIKHCRPGDEAVISLERTEEGVACAVRDTGPGIPAVHLPHVTRRFYRAAPQKVEGSGLGLALVEEVLRRHGSELTIESQAEGEETFTCARFNLPVLPE